MKAETAPSRNPVDRAHALARFDLAGCHYVGRVLFPPEPDRSIEDRFFPGWSNLLSPALQRLSAKTSSAMLQVVHDRERPVLEWPETVPCLVAAGNRHWADYEITCEVRCVFVRGFPYPHDETTFDSQGRTGLALRIQDTRRHYFAGFEGEDRLVIAVRDDAVWTVLASTLFQIDRRRYYQLAVRCTGNEIDLSVDGGPSLSVRDDRWRTGPAGLYTNVLCRWARAEIRCTPGEQRAIAERQSRQQQAGAAARKGVPPATTTLEFDLPIHDDAAASPIRFGSSLGATVVVDWSEPIDGRPTQVMLATDLRGREVWRRHFSGPREFFYAANDLDDDGRPEIVVVDGTRLYVLDGATGQSRAEVEYPEGSPFSHLRGQKARFNWRCPKLWRTGGPREPARIYLFEFTGSGGHTIWSYDHQLRPRWVHHNHSAKYGHDLTHYDVDDDGRKEIVAGYYALDDNGRYVWRVEDHDMIYKQEHTDNLWAGQMGGEHSIPRVVAVAGGSGVLILDARNGKRIKRLDGIGHMQRIAVGRFRHDLGGRQAWVWTDWGSPGIYSLLDENGTVLHRFQPDPRCTDGQTVTWWPDGRDLLLMRATPEVRGLWDAFGCKVVDLSILTGKAEIYKARVTATATDQIVCVDGRRLRVVGPGP